MLTAKFKPIKSSQGRTLLLSPDYLGLKIKYWCCDLCCCKLYRFTSSFKEVERRRLSSSDSCKDCWLSNSWWTNPFWSDSYFVLRHLTVRGGGLMNNDVGTWNRLECRVLLCVHEILNWLSFKAPSFTLEFGWTGESLWMLTEDSATERKLWIRNFCNPLEVFRRPV
jgi:hypothetical protein